MIRVAGTLNPMATPSKPALRKVCGITRPADAEHAASAGANAIGLIFYAQSPRAVTADTAQRVGAALPKGILRVGVFVGEHPRVIAAAVRQAGLDVVQLHGDESPRDCEAVRGETPKGTQIWKAVWIGAGFDGARLADFAVDAFLLDTARGGGYGGTGESFPWHLALPAKRYGKVILAGGLHGGNAAEAVCLVQPWGVDASSRLESRPGIKDPARVASYLQAVQ